MPFTNAELAEMLARASQQEERSHRARALRRASRAALYWREEAFELVEAGRPLAELRSVGPWLAEVLLGWLTGEDPREPPDPPPLRKGFLTLAEARAILATQSYGREIRADLQMHSTYSDGKDTLREMVDAAAGRGYEFVAITDHSKGLKIARGMDEQTLAGQGREIERLNEELRASGAEIHVLRSIEMNLSPEGEGDMDEAALAGLDLVLGAFHSMLRLREDQTERYLAAVRNPDVHVLAHPRGRRYDSRLGLHADWRRVFEEAALEDKAMEIDAYPDRQDLEIELLELARESGVLISIGTDAHSVEELRSMEFGLAAAARAGIPQERILNFMPVGELLAWAEAVRARRRR